MTEQARHWPALELCRARGALTPGHVRMEPARIQDETETYVPKRQAREEWEAELLSDEVVKRATDFAAASWDEDVPDTRQGIARGTLEAALAAAKERG